MIELAALAIFISFASAQEHEPPDPVETARRAERILEYAYSRQDVETFCMRNPDAMMNFSMQVNEDAEITLVIRCDSWHDWKSQQTKDDA